MLMRYYFAHETAPHADFINANYVSFILMSLSQWVSWAHGVFVKAQPGCFVFSPFADRTRCQTFGVHFKAPEWIPACVANKTKQTKQKKLVHLQ